MAILSYFLLLKRSLGTSGSNKKIPFSLEALDIPKAIYT